MVPDTYNLSVYVDLSGVQDRNYHTATLPLLVQLLPSPLDRTFAPGCDFLPRNCVLVSYCPQNAV